MGILANITWPSLVYYQRERAWWLIIVVIIVEFLILRRSLKTRSVWAFGIVVAINIFSAIVGAMLTFSSGFGRVPLLPWIGLNWTLYVDHGYYTYYAFCISVPCAAFISTVIESLPLFTVIPQSGEQEMLVLAAYSELGVGGAEFLHPMLPANNSAHGCYVFVCLCRLPARFRLAAPFIETTGR